ncbi:TPA: helix-turn-helix domain-containing protein [Enterococcus faecium]
MNLLERIKKLCNQRGISVYQLEEKIDIGRNTIYQWNKRTPSTEKIQKVADYFDVSTDYLLGRTDNPSEKNEDLAIKKTKVKMLARKMDNLDDSQLDTLDDLVNQFFDIKFDKGPDNDE